jgi:hypothetical protein
MHEFVHREYLIKMIENELHLYDLSYNWLKIREVPAIQKKESGYLDYKW